ncbi:MAG TPA: Rap1a/Tai family immunity protein [Motiliproteus sp.]
MHPTMPLFACALLLAQLWIPPTHASDRWDLLSWCTGNTPAELGRCEGLLGAALDLSIHTDFHPTSAPPVLCFKPGTHLGDLREAVIDWLRDNPVAEPSSGLGLVRLALRETYPCPLPTTTP